MADAEDIDIYGDDLGGGDAGDIYGGLDDAPAAPVEDSKDDVKFTISDMAQPKVEDEKPKGEVLPTAITSTPVFRSEPLPYNYKPLAALMINELHWYTKDEDLMTTIDDLGIRVRHQDIAFAEHKVNGKSKGTAYVEVANKDAAERVKRWFDTHDFQDKRMQAQHTPCVNGNPFKTIPKENSGKNANLAYQNQQLSRGSFRPRGGSRPPPSSHGRPPSGGGGGGGSGPPPMMGMPNMMGMPMNPAMMQQMMMSGRPPLPHMAGPNNSNTSQRGPSSSEDPRLAKRARQN